MKVKGFMYSIDLVVNCVFGYVTLDFKALGSLSKATIKDRI